MFGFYVFLNDNMTQEKVALKVFLLPFTFLKTMITNIWTDYKSWVLLPKSTRLSLSLISLVRRGVTFTDLSPLQEMRITAIRWRELRRRAEPSNGSRVESKHTIRRRFCSFETEANFENMEACLPSNGLCLTDCHCDKVYIGDPDLAPQSREQFSYYNNKGGIIFYAIQNEREVPIMQNILLTINGKIQSLLRSEQKIGKTILEHPLDIIQMRHHYEAGRRVHYWRNKKAISSYKKELIAFVYRLFA